MAPIRLDNDLHLQQRLAEDRPKWRPARLSADQVVGGECARPSRLKRLAAGSRSWLVTTKRD